MSAISIRFRGLSPLALLLVGLLAVLWRPGLAHASGAVGSGTPDSCTEAALNAALMGGGLVTFNCGGAKTITVSYYKTIEADTTIDGGGVITLSGGNAASLFQVFDGRSLTLQNITLANGKSVDMAAGAIENFGTTTIISSTLRDNVSTSNGGAIVNYGALNLNNTTVSKNQAAMKGGGIYNDGGVVKINNSQFLENAAIGSDGGAINVNSGRVDIQTSTLGQNFGITGGAIFIKGEATAHITTSAIDNNMADEGGGIHNEGHLVFSQSTLNLNNARVGGGIVSAGQSSGALTGVTLSGNNAAQHGGGIFLQGTVDAGLSLTDLTLSGNSADRNGGGIYNQAATAHLTNVTLSGNGANAGGGIYQNSGLMSLSFVSVVSNTAAAFGGGIYNYDAGEMKLQNTLLANNSVGNCDGSGFTSLGHNLANDNNCNAALNQPTDKRGATVALPLGALANNGGPTFTHLPLSGNQAIDGGVCVDGVNTDQRNLPRPAGATCDAGAVESSSLWRIHLPLVVKQQAASGETGGRYRADETPAGLTAAEWAQVRAHIEEAQPATEEPPAQQAYVKASNTGAKDKFGYAVALAGDTLAVGAPIEYSSAVGVNPPGGQADDSAPNAGAVYVFTRSGGVWSQQAYLKASNAGSGDIFGSAVALAGDTLAVGAPFEASNAGGVNGNQGDNSAGQAGAVYVFTRSGGVWSQQAYLKASNTGTRDRFGAVVALAGDTLAVGAVGEDSNAVGIDGNQGDNSARDAGAVYIFTRSGAVWSQQAYVKASNTEADDNFGQSVALAGDTLALGANGEDSSVAGVNPPGGQVDNSAPESGAVYLFTRSGGVWSQQAYLKASIPGGSDYFGWAVALAGDTLAVGATGEASSAVGVNPLGGEADNSAPNAGAVYLFTRNGGMWSQQAYLKASNTGAADSFGRAVALAGDTLAVGADYEASSAVGVTPPGGQADNSAPQAGAVYVFTRSGGVWGQQAYVKASNTGWYDSFGRTVALSGDTLAVGATGEASSATGVNPPGGQADDSAVEAGAAYVLTGFGPPARTDQTIRFDPLPDRLVTDPPFSISATASSGLPVSLAALTPNVCAMSGAQVTLLTTGTCLIQAGQAGDPAFNPAPPVVQAFAVKSPQKAGQSITFAPLADRMLGDLPFALNASASSGLPVSFLGATQSVCLVDGATVTLVAAGVCAIIATQEGNATLNPATPAFQRFAVVDQDGGEAQKIYLPALSR